MPMLIKYNIKTIQYQCQCEYNTIQYNIKKYNINANANTIQYQNNTISMPMIIQYNNKTIKYKCQ